MVAKKFASFLAFIIHVVVISLEKTLRFIPLKQTFYQLFLDRRKCIKTTEHEFLISFLGKICNFSFCCFMNHP